LLLNSVLDALYNLKAVLRIRIQRVPGTGSGSKRAKMTHKNKIKIRNFFVEVLDVLF
jgi:hypothetical protein